MPHTALHGHSLCQCVSKNGENCPKGQHIDIAICPTTHSKAIPPVNALEEAGKICFVRALRRCAAGAGRVVSEGIFLTDGTTLPAKTVAAREPHRDIIPRCKKGRLPGESASSHASAGCAGYYQRSSSETVSFLRQWRRRAERTRRPLAEAILSRNPCLLTRLRREGWNVLFIVSVFYIIRLYYAVWPQ